MKFSLMRTLEVYLRKTSGLIAIALGAAWRLVGPGLALSPTPTPAGVFFSWADDLPQTMIEAFTAACGVKGRSLTYAVSEAAVTSRRAALAPDVARVDNVYFPALSAEAQLAPFAAQRPPTVHNLAANFRDPVTDPGHHSSISGRRPALSAKILNLAHAVAAYEAAHPLLAPRLFSAGVRFPQPEALAPAEWYAPRSPAGEKLSADLRVRLLAASQ